MSGAPSPEVVAEWLGAFCDQRGIQILLIDGPQGWKAKDNGLQHSRCCERELNTPAKTGEPMSVKPANYGPFVKFSIAVYDALTTCGWERLPASGIAITPGRRFVIESFPLSAWRSLHLVALPSKAKARRDDLTGRLAALQELFPIRLSGTPTHDEMQALVSGIAGLSVEHNEWEACIVSGRAPTYEDGSWREGFIVNPIARNAHGNPLPKIMRPS